MYIEILRLYGNVEGADSVDEPAAAPANPTPSGITNDNDTFATANALPGIDGSYVERIGDSNVNSVHADYTARHTLRRSGARTNGSRGDAGVRCQYCHVAGFQVSGIQLAR